MQDKDSAYNLVGVAQELFAERVKHPLVHGFIIGFIYFNGIYFWEYFIEAGRLSVVEYIGQLVQDGDLNFKSPIWVMLAFPVALAIIELCLALIDTLRGNGVAWIQKKLNKHDVYDRYHGDMKKINEQLTSIYDHVDNFLEELENAFPKDLETKIHDHSKGNNMKGRQAIGPEFIGEVNDAVEKKNQSKGKFIEAYNSQKNNFSLPKVY